MTVRESMRRVLVLAGLVPILFVIAALSTEPAALATLGEWTIQPTPNPSEAEERQQTLSGVSCRGGQCLAVGSHWDPEASGPLVEHWNGEEWLLRASPSGVEELNDVDCASVGLLCLAAGGKESQAWMGLWTPTPTPAWQPLTTEKPAGASTLKGVSCLLETVCWAVGTRISFGSTLAVRWNQGKSKFEIVETPTKGESSELNSVSCTEASSCVAVGHYIEFGEKRPLAMRWNGTKWSTQELPVLEAEGSDTYLSDVSCTGGGASTTCMAVGANETGAPQTAVAMFWDGEEWSATTPEAPGALESDFTLHGVACISESECHAAGSYEVEGAETRTLIEEWDEGSWSISLAPNPEGRPMNELRDISCLASASDCVAVGSTFESPSASDTLAMHHG